MKRIKEKKTWIDPEIVSCNYKHTEHHSVMYYIYGDKKERKKNNYIYIPKNPGKTFGAELNTPICFSALMQQIQSAEKPINRIHYYLGEDKHNLQITSEEKIAWIKMARRHLLLPPYIKVNSVRTGIIVLDTSTITPALLYCYLATFRFIREDPGFIRAMVHLVNERKMNFYVAFVVATRICQTQDGHAVIEYCRPYMNSVSANESSFSTNLMIGLRRFAVDPEKHSQTPDRIHTFGCQNTIRDICKINYLCPAKKLFSQNLVKAVYSKGDAEASMYISKLQAEKVENE